MCVYEHDGVLLCLGSDDYIVELGAISHLNMNQDVELALRFTTGIKNGDEFFTDLNGFQVMIRTDRQCWSLL